MMRLADFKPAVHWLEWFCHPDVYHRADHPFQLPNGWAAATEGRFAVGCPTDQVFKPMENPRHIPSFLVEAFAAKSEKTIVLPRETAIELFGPCVHPYTKKCSECGGRKEIPHSCDCEMCEADTEPCGQCGDEDTEPTGIETVKPDRRAATCWGTPFDANRVAYILEHSPEAKVYEFRLFSRNPDGISKMMYLTIHTAAWSALTVELVTTEACPEVFAEIPAKQP